MIGNETNYQTIVRLKKPVLNHLFIDSEKP